MHLFLSLKIQMEASLNGPPLDLKPSACLQPEYKFSTVLGSVTMAPLQGEAAQTRALCKCPARLLGEALQVHFH